MYVFEKSASRPARAFFRLSASWAWRSLVVICGFVLGLVLAVACARPAYAYYPSQEVILSEQYTGDGVYGYMAVAYNNYNAAALSLGFSLDDGRLTADARSKLSSPDTGGDFWLFANGFKTKSQLGEYPVWVRDARYFVQTWETIAGSGEIGPYLDIWYGEGAVALVESARRDFETVLDGGDLDGGGAVEGDVVYTDTFIAGAVGTYLDTRGWFDTASNFYAYNTNLDSTLTPLPSRLPVTLQSGFADMVRGWVSDGYDVILPVMSGSLVDYPPSPVGQSTRMDAYVLPHGSYDWEEYTAFGVTVPHYEFRARESVAGWRVPCYYTFNQGLAFTQTSYGSVESATYDDSFTRVIGYPTVLAVVDDASDIGGGGGSEPEPEPDIDKPEITPDGYYVYYTDNFTLADSTIFNGVKGWKFPSTDTFFVTKSNITYNDVLPNRIPLLYPESLGRFIENTREQGYDAFAMIGNPTDSGSVANSQGYLFFIPRGTYHFESSEFYGLIDRFYSISFSSGSYVRFFCNYDMVDGKIICTQFSNPSTASGSVVVFGGEFGKARSFLDFIPDPEPEPEPEPEPPIPQPPVGGDWPEDPIIDPPTPPEVPTPPTDPTPTPPTDPTPPDLPVPWGITLPTEGTFSADLQGILDAMAEHCRHLQNAIHVNATSLAQNLGGVVRDNARYLADGLRTYVYWAVGEWRTEIGGLRDYLYDLFRWLADQLDFDAGARYDDATVVSWLKRIYLKLGNGSVDTRPVDPVADPPGIGDWLTKFWDNFLLNLVAVAPDRVGEVAEDLQELIHKFPFSIPWDIAALLGLLVAPAQPPVVDLPQFYVDGDLQLVRVDGYVHVDLSPYDGYWEPVRLIMKIAFAVYLATQTKGFMDLLDLGGGRNA